MKSPADDPDNLYQAPNSALVKGDLVVPAEDRSPNGSFVRVGPRQLFTARRIWSTVIRRGGMLVLHVVVSFGLGISVGLLAGEGAGLIVVIIALIVLMFLLTGFYADVNMAERLFRNPSLNPGTDFYVEMTFHPRLPGTRAEHVWDSADDIGIISCAGELMEYRGDRVTMTLNRRDVLGSRRKRATMRGGWSIGPSIQLQLGHALLGRASVEFGIREGFHTLRAMRRSREMCRAIEEWFRRDESR